ncbi:transcriptional regulator [Anaerostipes sp. MSJ-23]|uniref:transcriptional regulator n=1 Tax=Anaerostipes sp. MSJ-23 TaxID=2841520 RepID=UPI001C1018C2|nr:transcriptional regulator [Anaerostipes sp. MSJ-23]MBU5459375.1 transcriptional regulator [Anaerostipes sp. MSJ-23]
MATIYNDGFMEETSRIDRLIEEILSGQHKIDKLPKSSVGFSGPAQAEYFSKARFNLESDVNNLIVHHGQRLEELKLLRKIKKAGK